MVMDQDCEQEEVKAMDPVDFRARAHKMVDFIADYYRDIEDYPVCSRVTPGYLQKLLPSMAPEKPETFDQILNDVKSMIIPGLTHWQNPNFFGFFPSNSSTAGMLGEFLSGGLNVDGFEWETCPAATELEMLVLNWFAKLLNLPDDFLFGQGGGGGAIHASASEAVLLVLLAARARAIEENAAKGLTERETLSKLCVYASDQTHPCLQKACVIIGLPKRNFMMLPTSAANNFSLSPSLLRSAIEDCVSQGFIPLFLGATVGTTSASAVDDLSTLGDIAKEYRMWFHVDAAYAGNACICPEYRHFLDGIEKGDSFNLSANKWLLTNIDCSVLWIKDSKILTSTLSTSSRMKLKLDDPEILNFKDWQIAQGRRFRSLKLWLVMRMYGASGLRNYIRNHINNAKHFENLVRKDDHFEILAPCNFGLVCFRLKPFDQDNENGCKLNNVLLEAVNSKGKIFITHTVLSGVYALRMSIGGTRTTLDNVISAWSVIQREAEKLLKLAC